MNVRSLTLAALIVLVALLRLVQQDNFAPMTALAVFAGVRFRGWREALLVPLAALLLSDLGKEILYRYGYARDWGLYSGMWVVYGTTALVALLARSAQGSRSPAALAAATVSGSCLFFLVTNFAVWAGGALYPRTVGGLLACYVAAIPFFRASLFADALFAAVLFGAWGAGRGAGRGAAAER